MEIGMSIHGKPGVRKGPVLAADEVADDMVSRLLEDFRDVTGSSFAVLVNGLRATPLEELYILYRRVHRRLVDLDYRVHRAAVGEYATSLEMAGASVSLLQLDDEPAKLLDASSTAGF